MSDADEYLAAMRTWAVEQDDTGLVKMLDELAARRAAEIAIRTAMAEFGQYVSAVCYGVPTPPLTKGQYTPFDQIQDAWNKTAWEIYDRLNRL